MSDNKEIVKLEKKLGGEFFSLLRGSTDAELKSKLQSHAVDYHTLHQAMVTDSELNELQEKIKEVKAPYENAVKINMLRQRAIFLVMQEKGSK
jgi:NAD-dependent DNA ligase